MQKEAKSRIKINNLLQDSTKRFFDDKMGPKNIEVENNVNLEELNKSVLRRAFAGKL